MALVMVASCGKTKDAWQGTVEEIDGITVVKNPLEPLYGIEAFRMEEELCIGETEGREEYMFQRLYTLVVNPNEDIYVLDYQAKHIKMFDKEGTYIRTIGKPGQGPGELQIPLGLFFSYTGELIVGDTNRISYFTEDGEFIKSTPYKGGMIHVRKIDQEGNFYATDIIMEKGIYEVKKYDPEFNYLISFGSSPLQSAGGSKKRNPFFTLIRFDLIQGARLICGYAGEGYILKIMDTERNLLRRIEKDYTPLEPTQEDVDESQEGIPPEMKRELDVPKYFPPFRGMMTDDEGRIYVSTFKRTPDRKKYYYDIFDAEGKYILTVPFKSGPRIILNNRIYTIEEDEDGYQCVKRYKVSWNY